MQHQVLLGSLLFLAFFLFAKPAGANKYKLSSWKQKLHKLFVQLERDRAEMVREWVKIAKIPAPSKQEKARATYIARQFRKFGWKVRMDRIGNVIAHLPSQAKTKKATIFAAHLDTVFSKKTKLRFKKQGTRIFGPGIADNTAGIFALVVLAKYIHQFKLTFRKPIWLVATVQEELGLIGSQYFIKQHQSNISKFISLDGGLGGISYGALGIYWYKIRFFGNERHTLSSVNQPSTTHALAKSIQAIYKLTLPMKGMKKSWLNIGKVGGGSVVNAQAKEAWFTLDLRSLDGKQLKILEQQVFNIVRSTAKQTKVQYNIDTLQKFPAAQLKNMKNHKLVQMSKKILQHLGVKKIRLSPLGANDHCAAIVKGIPGINIGIAHGKNIHSLRESVETKHMITGLKQLFYLAALHGEAKLP